MKTKSKSIKLLEWGAYLFPLLSSYCFGATFIDLGIWKGCYFAAIMFILLYVARDLFKKHISSNAKNIRNIILCFLFSIIMSYFLWGQSIVLGYRSTAPILGLLYFFLLKKIGLSYKKTEYIIYVYAIIWICIWALMLYTPIRLFGQEADTRGVARFFIPNDCFIYLLYFLSLNKWLICKRKIFAVISICLFIIIVLQVTRQTIIFTTIVSLYYIFKKKKFIIVYLLLAFFALQFLSLSFKEDSAVGSLISLSEQQLKENKHGDTYVRILEYEYFFFEFNPNPIAAVFGNGVPHDESTYGFRILYDKMMKRYFLSDVGYAAIYIQIGILGLLIFFSCFYSLYKDKKLSPYCNGAKMYLYYIFLVDTMSYVFSFHIVTFAIAFYLIDLSNRESSKVFINE